MSERKKQYFIGFLMVQNEINYVITARSGTAARAFERVDHRVAIEEVENHLRNSKQE